MPDTHSHISGSPPPSAFERYLDAYLREHGLVLCSEELVRHLAERVGCDVIDDSDPRAWVIKTSDAT